MEEYFQEKSTSLIKTGDVNKLRINTAKAIITQFALLKMSQKFTVNHTRFYLALFCFSIKIQDLGLNKKSSFLSCEIIEAHLSTLISSTKTVYDAQC